jgi:ELWxxDGT repeat protein
MVKDIFLGPGNGLHVTYNYVSTLQYMIEWNGNLFFVAQSGNNQQELWRTDGTSAGTVKVSQFNSSVYRPFVSQLVLLRDRLYFLYQMNDGSKKLISSDGTTVGTMEVSSQSFSLTSEYIAKGYFLLYFCVHTPQTGFELWRSDGTAAGTFMVKDLNPGPGYGMYPFWEGGCFMDWDDIYFGGDNGQTGLSIYTSDGSLGSGALVFNAQPAGTTSNYVGGFCNINNKLSARMSTSQYGDEPWISDNQILLPELLSFSGRPDGSSAKLEWKTRNEENCSHFEIERSIDSVSFSRIGTVQAYGGNVMEGNYLYTDPGLPEGTFYYRLKIISSGGILNIVM